MLLETIKGLGLRCVIVSNGIWRNETDYWEDLRDFDLAPNVHAIVSSVDTLWRKPSERFYLAALQAAKTTPDQCLLVGNSEAKDIEPAVRLRMATIRAAIEDDRPPATQASYLYDSLLDVVEVIKRICNLD